MRLVALLICALAAPAVAEPPVLDLPIDCRLGQDCYIEDYVDADPGPGRADYACGLKTRDAHRGTDFVLSDVTGMPVTVDVLAAAPGVVSATRDGMADAAVTDQTRDRIKGRECGNAVRLDHGDGWQTLYCHMARGSVLVSDGDRVVAGQPLGRVGLSGLTNVPHVHLSVLHDGQPVDPFNPGNSSWCGAEAGDGLWREAPAYTAAGLFTAGFSTAVPTFAEVQSGAARVRSGPPDQPIVLYAHAFHPQKGDRLELSAIGPAGEIFREEFDIDDPQAQIFRAFGRRSPGAGWPAGDYRGVVRLMRDGVLLAMRHADYTVRLP